MELSFNREVKEPTLSKKRFFVCKMRRLPYRVGVRVNENTYLYNIICCT